ncbi:MAG: DUF1592 domain-containing protein [Myxococcales bacterium]|nr:DUF1592 domain-containing protein [Myxococcales bacterium]
MQSQVFHPRSACLCSATLLLALLVVSASACKGRLGPGAPNGSALNPLDQPGQPGARSAANDRLALPGASSPSGAPSGAPPRDTTGRDEGTPAQGTSAMPDPFEDQPPVMGADGQAQPRDVSFACDPGATAGALRMRRLTEQQYRNSLQAAFASVMGGGANGLMSALSNVLSELPADHRFKASEDLHGSYRRLDQAVSQKHVETWYEVSLAAGQWVTANGRLADLAGDCAVDNRAENDGACLDDLIDNLGAALWRRPLTDQEHSLYRALYGTAPGEDPAGYADVVAGLLNAPQFLYLVEHGETASDPFGERLPAETYALSAYELATRLAYHFWDSPPDRQLLELARSGALLEPSTYEAQIERLVNDPRTRATVREFFRDWLKLEDLPELDANNDFADFQAFAGDDLPSANLREEMIEEVLDLLDYHTWELQTDLKTVLTTDLAFPGDELARLYGLEAWNGTDTPPSLPGDQRPGLLTRAAFLSTGTANTRPIMKGVFIRRNLLCDGIPPPPDNAAADAPAITPDVSTRQLVEEITEQAGTACAGCHTTLINPLGFATEGYDALGRVRREQLLVSEEGEVLGTAPVDTLSVPRIFLDDDTVSQGPHDLMRLIAQSGKAEACLARHYFRFSFGRFEDVTTDGCVLESLRRALAGGGTLPDMLKAVALATEFRTRSFAPTALEAP